MLKICGIIIASIGIIACNPTVRLESEKPIHIIADVTIKHEIKIKVEKDVEQVLASGDLF
ncbi:YnbE family lipoprotein [Aliikangiella maris]|uniref:YnbE family lipoprotein n=2 Tax=Aliikangiella maris TaxID=3162458 RepID=A0ABV3MP28_9GAMM